LSRSLRARIKKLLVQRERLEPTAPEVDDVLGEFIPTVRAHVAEEAGPHGTIERLRAAVGGYRVGEMRRSLAKAKRTVPTHPHPHTRDTPPANAVARPGRQSRRQPARRGQGRVAELK
jgi:hypothetical protein